MQLRLSLALLPGLIVGLSPFAVRAGGAPTVVQTTAGKGGAAWATVITLGSTSGLAIDPRGNPSGRGWAYSVNPYNRTVVKFGTGGRRLATWRYAPPAHFFSPAGVAVGGGGNVFVADGGNGRVVKFDPFGHQLAVFTGFNMPASVAVDRRGNIFVADVNLSQVTKLSPAGQVLAHWHVPWVDGTGNTSPRSVAVDRQGNVYVGAYCGSRCPPPHGIQYAVIKLNPSGMPAGSLLGNNPYVPVAAGQQAFVVVNTVAVDLRDNLYVGCDIRTVAGTFRPAILVYSSALALQRTYTLPGQGVPNGIAFDAADSLYVAANGRVLKRIL